MTSAEIIQFVRTRFAKVLTARMTPEQAEVYVQEIADRWEQDVETAVLNERSASASYHDI